MSSGVTFGVGSLPDDDDDPVVNHLGLVQGAVCAVVLVEGWVVAMEVVSAAVSFVVKISNIRLAFFLRAL